MPWHIRTFVVIAFLALPVYLYLGLRLAAAITHLTGSRKRAMHRPVLWVLLWLYILPLTILVVSLTTSAAPSFLLGGQVGMIDYLFHYPFWLGLIAALEVLPYVVAIDISLVLARVHPAFRKRWMSVQAWLKIGLLVVAAIYVPIRANMDTNVVRDSRVELTIPSLPRELDGLRLSLLGDLQIDRYTGDAKVSLVRSIIGQFSPDYVFSAGDIVTAGKEYIPAAARALCPPPVPGRSIAVLGDHDFWADRVETPRVQRRCGWLFLDNEHRILHRKGRSILVTGLTHIYSRKMADNALDTFLSHAPDADLKILIVHQPAEDVVGQAAAHGYHLMLAGHTHGGQIVFHPFGIPLTPSQRETKYYTGSFTVGQMKLVVTNGIGLTLAPLRYHARAEVNGITLRSPGSEGAYTLPH